MPFMLDVTTLVVYCGASLIVFAGLCLFRVISDEYIPIAGMIAATLAGMLAFHVTGWLVWKVMSGEGSGGHGFLPHLVTVIVMVPIIWKWPKADISLGKSVVAGCSQVFLVYLAFGTIMAVAAGGAIYLIPFGVLLVIMVVVWRL